MSRRAAGTALTFGKENSGGEEIKGGGCIATKEWVLADGGNWA